MRAWMLLFLLCAGCSARPARCVLNVEVRYTPICTTAKVQTEWETK